MLNPFNKDYPVQSNDQALIVDALEGNKGALEQILLKHQAWIYNIVLRMVLYPEDAEDITQEILIKIMTKLSTYEQRSSFRTWLYKLVVNHVLNVKQSKAEKQYQNLKKYSKAIIASPDTQLPAIDQYPVEMKILLDEVKFHCIMGMLVCLERKQRIIFILGELFSVDSLLGAEILNMTPANFRQILSRARKAVRGFIQQTCGKFNKSNPCMCENKLSLMIAGKAVNPAQLSYNPQNLPKLQELIKNKIRHFHNFMDIRKNEIMADQPFYDFNKSPKMLADLLQNKEFCQIFDL